MDQMIGGHNGSGRVMVLVMDGFDNVAVVDAAKESKISLMESAEEKRCSWSGRQEGGG